ncbi:restriction endonuclease subunit S [Ruegeria pomeroyi]|uniref:Restriction endonuclease subunit S n=1 Tax=Ruegeria pomeroyi TaxID=89184 RepID=A0A9Q3WPP9_9RHOB|nr:restriction endonuclease subunit S [Ruegeria pomeroyi]MCE8540140.1 restriction endonuclease subunit S [Ruegeria pomeroyi]
MEKIPKLRFPEFSEDWTPERCDYYLKRVSIPVDVEPERMYREIGIRSHGRGVFHKEPVRGTDLGAKRVFQVVPNSLAFNIVFAWEQALAKLSEAEAGLIASHRFPMFVSKDERSDLNFFRYFFLRPRGKYLLELASPGGAGRNKTLGQNNFAELNVTAPKFPEQQKIATFLATVDEKIEQLTREKALLEDYIKGCMQKLFSQEVRFKDDQDKDFPDWEELLVGDVFGWVRTNSLSREKLSLEATGEVQNIHYGDIHTKFGPNFHQTDEPVPYIKGSIRADFNVSDFCRVGDVVIADASEDYADIGKAIEVVETSETPLVAGLHTYIARPKGKKLATGFSGYLLRSQSMRRQIMRIAQGISVLGVSKGNLEKLKLHLPHPEEQKKIAGFLSSIDRRIDMVSKELNKAQEFKKGLLQQMFV